MICVCVCTEHSNAAALRLWLEYTLKHDSLSSMERVILPTQIPQIGAPESALNPELSVQDRRSVSEKTLTVVKEVVEQEKRKESTQKS